MHPRATSGDYRQIFSARRWLNGLEFVEALNVTYSHSNISYIYKHITIHAYIYIYMYTDYALSPNILLFWGSLLRKENSNGEVCLFLKMSTSYFCFLWNLEFLVKQTFGGVNWLTRKPQTDEKEDHTPKLHRGFFTVIYVLWKSNR